MSDLYSPFKSNIYVYTELESVKEFDYHNIIFCESLDEVTIPKLHIYITGDSEINPLVKEYRKSDLFEEGKSLPRVISTTASEIGKDIDLIIPEGELHKFLNFFNFYGTEGIIVDGLGAEGLLQSVNGRLIYNHRFCLKQNISEIVEELQQQELKGIMMAVVISGRGLRFMDECMSLIQETCKEVDIVFDLPRRVFESIEEYIEVFVFDGMSRNTDDKEVFEEIQNILSCSE